MEKAKNQMPFMVKGKDLYLQPAKYKPGIVEKRAKGENPCFRGN